MFIVANLLIQYARTGDINNLGGYKGPYLDTVYECIPYIDDAAYDDDARVRFDAANKMLLLLWPYMESYIRQVREDIKNHTNKAETELGEQLAGGAPLPGGLGKPVSGKKGKHDPGNDEDERTQLQQVLDHEDGRIELKKTDEIGEDGDGGTSRTSDYAGSGYVSQAAEDMERIMTQLAEDAAYASYEQELSEELQAESDKIRYGNAHKGVHVNVNRMCYVDPSYMEAYQKVAPPLLLISKRLQKQVSQDSNLRCFCVTDLQSAALAARHTHPWGDQGESTPRKQSHISAKRTAFALLPLSYGHSSSCGTRTRHFRLERPAS